MSTASAPVAVDRPRPALGWAGAAAAAVFVAGLLVGWSSVAQTPAAPPGDSAAGAPWTLGAILARNLGAAALLYSGVLTCGLSSGVSLAVLSAYVGATAKVGVLNVGAGAVLGSAGWYAGPELLGCLAAAAAGLHPVTAALRAGPSGSAGARVRRYLAALPGSLCLFAAAVVLLLVAAGVEAALIARV